LTTSISEKGNDFITGAQDVIQRVIFFSSLKAGIMNITVSFRFNFVILFTE